MHKEVMVEAIPMASQQRVTKINVKINISNLLDELKLFDALFHIELTVGEKLYHYSFIKRNITESKVIFPMSVEGEVKDLINVSYTIHISYI